MLVGPQVRVPVEEEAADDGDPQHCASCSLHPPVVLATEPLLIISTQLWQRYLWLGLLLIHRLRWLQEQQLYAEAL